MPVTRAIIVLDSDLPGDAVTEWQQVAANFAAFAAERVLVAAGPAASVAEIVRLLERPGGDWDLAAAGGDTATTDPSAPMSAAPFRYREDGRPDWAAMWTDFCELALYGGPPHRGEEDALVIPHGPVDLDGSEALAEIRRGIFETTGLYSEPAENGWIAVTCQSTRMAAWLCATIILENVEARCVDEVLYLPISPQFELKNEIKSVVTVLAKTNHYWEAHIASQQ